MALEAAYHDAMTQKIDAAFRQACFKVVERALRTGTPIIIWEDGQVKAVPPEHFPDFLPTAKDQTAES